MVRPVVINGSNGIDAAKAYGLLKNQNNALPKKQNTGKTPASADILDISAEARQAQVYKTAMKSVPEVRDDLIAAIKKGIEAGTYKPEPVKIAESMLDSTIYRW
jgi:flagellar biosynthesis anti-sigma factor FlgM